MLIGLIGKAGAGKSEAAKHLAREHNLKRAAFADLLKHALIHWGVPSENIIGDQNQKDAPLRVWGGVSGRQYMQKLGQSMRDLDPDFWVTAFWDFNADQKHMIIEDVRMPNEARSIEERGGLLIKIERDGPARTKHSQHVSETSVDAVRGHILIKNDQSLSEFHRQLEVALRRWQAGIISQNLYVDRKQYISHI